MDCFEKARRGPGPRAGGDVKGMRGGRRGRRREGEGGGEDGEGEGEGKGKGGGERGWGKWEGGREMGRGGCGKPVRTGVKKNFVEALYKLLGPN